MHYCDQHPSRRPGFLRYLDRGVWLCHSTILYPIPGCTCNSFYRYSATLTFTLVMPTHDRKWCFDFFPKGVGSKPGKQQKRKTPANVHRSEVDSVVNPFPVYICDRIWENPACCDACAIILIIIFVAMVILLRNSYLSSYGEINLSSMLYYVYRRRYGLTSSQKADIFERSWRPERAAASPRRPLSGGTN